MKALSKEVEEPGYFERPEISNSDIGFYEQYGARAFHGYKNRSEDKETSDAMSLGSLIHSYILEYNKFDNIYGCCIESPGPMMGRFVEYIVNNS